VETMEVLVTSKCVLRIVTEEKRDWIWKDRIIFRITLMMLSYRGSILVKYRKQQIISRCHEADWSARKSRKNKKI